MGFNILQLISSGGLFGAETVLLELSSELKAMDHSVTIGVFRNRHSTNLDILESARARSIPIHIFECRGKFDFRTVKEISNYVEKNRIDLIHSHGYKSNIFSALSSLRTKKPLVTTCHNWINGGAKMRFYTILDKLFLKRFNYVIPVSRTVEEKLLKAGIKREKIKLIENGVNVGKFRLNVSKDDFRKKFVPDSNSKIIGTVGRLSPEKGMIYLLEAAQIILSRQRDCYFLIVGDGKNRAELEDKAKALGISERVLFTGKRDDIPDLLSIMDIFVLPSLVEGQPMALLEAMAARKPVVATDVGDIPKILKNGILGRIVPVQNPRALAESLSFYLQEPELACQVGDAAFQEVNQHYSSSRMSKEYLEIYNRLAIQA